MSLLEFNDLDQSDLTIVGEAVAKEYRNEGEQGRNVLNNYCQGLINILAQQMSEIQKYLHEKENLRAGQ